MARCFLLTLARPASGLRDTFTVEKTAGCLGHFRGHLWPMRHRTRSDVLWRIPAGSVSRYVAMEASQ